MKVLMVRMSVSLLNAEPQRVYIRAKTQRAHDSAGLQFAAFSDAGSHVAWTDENTAVLADATTGAVQARLQTGNPFSRRIEFSHDGRRLAVGGSNEADVFDVQAGSLIWSTDAAGAVRWSLDDSKILIARRPDGDSILDARTGGLIARPDAGSKGVRTVVSPDLRHALVIEQSKAYAVMLPAPDEGPPAQRLAAILYDAGLALRGADLVDADR